MKRVLSAVLMLALIIVNDGILTFIELGDD